MTVTPDKLKIVTGDLLLNLKLYLLATNEYGVPTKDTHKNLFVTNFLGYILNDNFGMLGYEKTLNSLWEAACKAADKLGVTPVKTQGFHFFKQLSLEQSDIKSEEDLYSYINNYEFKAELPQEIRNYIEEHKMGNDWGDAERVVSITNENGTSDYYRYNPDTSELKLIKGSEHPEEMNGIPYDVWLDKQYKNLKLLSEDFVRDRKTDVLVHEYIVDKILKPEEIKKVDEVEEEEVTQVYLENTPSLIKNDAYGDYVEIHANYKGCSAWGKLYYDNTVLLSKFSSINDLVPSAGDSVTNIRNKYAGDIIRNVVQKDIHLKSINQAGSLVFGSNVNSWNTWHNSENKLIDIYRYKPKNTKDLGVNDKMHKVCISNTPELLKVDERGVYVDIKFIMSSKNILATGKLYDNGCVLIKKGSQVDDLKPGAWGYSRTVRASVADKIESNKLIEDIICKSLNQANNITYGGEGSAWEYWRNSKDQSVRIYTNPVKICDEYIEKWTDQFKLNIDENAGIMVGLEDGEDTITTYCEVNGNKSVILELNVKTGSVVVKRCPIYGLMYKEFKSIEAFITNVLIHQKNMNILDETIKQEIKDTLLPSFKVVDKIYNEEINLIDLMY